MRRWNGWGDDTVIYPLPSAAKFFIEQEVGKSKPPLDVTLDNILAQVPKSRLPSHSLVSTDALTRVLHSRGQSFPNWVDLRKGQISRFPDGVAYPMSDQDVIELIQLAHKLEIHIIPYGGGTSVVGHIDTINRETPSLIIDMSRMNGLLELDPTSLLATFHAGVTGPDLEAQLRAHGFTLGHFPQSFEYSTLGGWVATRSSGQQSLHYGRIENLFSGGRMETPLGEFLLPSFPASAAGPNLKEMVLGSEGRLGILTQAQVQISHLPEREEFHAAFFPDFQQGIEAVQNILFSGLSLCMLRLSTAQETKTTLALAGHETLIKPLERLLTIRHLGNNKCMLIFGFCGKSAIVQANRKEALSIIRKYGGIHVGRIFGEQWHKNRFRTPYLRNTLWEIGYGIDTLETATNWSNTPRMIDQIESALQDAISSLGEKVHIFTHLSHVYQGGSSIYTTYLFKLAEAPDEIITQWQKMKAAASEAIVSNGGTISHQHGVGLDHLQYLAQEKGPIGMEVIESVFRQFDPKGIMNPGKLIS